MEYIIISICLIVVLILLKNIYAINMKKIKELSQPNPLDNITNRLPEDEQVCEEILKQINNETVKIKRSVDEKSRYKFIYGNK